MSEMGGWVSIAVNVPKYGDLVKVKSSEVDESLIYVFDGCDVCPDWFEPHDSNKLTAVEFELNCCFWDDVTHWQKVELPKP